MTVTDIETASPSAPLRTDALQPSDGQNWLDHPSFPPVTEAIQEEPQVVIADEFNAIKGADIVTDMLAVPDTEVLKTDVARFIADIKDQIARGDLVLDSPDDVLVYAAAMIAASIPQGQREAIELAFEDRRQLYEQAGTAGYHESMASAQRQVDELQKEMGLKVLGLAVLKAKADEAIDAIDNPNDWLRAKEIMARNEVSEAYFQEPFLQ